MSKIPLYVLQQLPEVCIITVVVVVVIIIVVVVVVVLLHRYLYLLNFLNASPSPPDSFTWWRQRA